MFRFGIGVASPSMSLSTPAMMWISVDLPEPFRPSTPIFAPERTTARCPSGSGAWRHDLADPVHRENVLGHFGVKVRSELRLPRSVGVAASGDSVAGACCARRRRRRVGGASGYCTSPPSVADSGAAAAVRIGHSAEATATRRRRAVPRARAAPVAAEAVRAVRQRARFALSGTRPDFECAGRARFRRRGCDTCRGGRDRLRCLKPVGARYACAGRAARRTRRKCGGQRRDASRGGAGRAWSRSVVIGAGPHVSRSAEEARRDAGCYAALDIDAAPSASAASRIHRRKAATFCRSA